MFASRGSRPARLFGMTGAVVAASAAIAIAMLPLATPASGDRHLDPHDWCDEWRHDDRGGRERDRQYEWGHAAVLPTWSTSQSGTPLTSTSPTAGCVDENGTFVCDNDLIFNAGDTTTHDVSIAVGQLTPNTTYHFELQGEDDNGTFPTADRERSPRRRYQRARARRSSRPTTRHPMGSSAMLQATPACVNDMNGVRANQEELPPLSLPTNWSTLTGPEQMFVWTNLERVSRGEAPDHEPRQHLRRRRPDGPHQRR